MKSHGIMRTNDLWLGFILRFIYQCFIVGGCSIIKKVVLNTRERISENLKVFCSIDWGV